MINVTNLYMIKKKLKKESFVQYYMAKSYQIAFKQNLWRFQCGLKLKLV